MNRMKFWMGLALCALLPAVSSAASADHGKKSRARSGYSAPARGHVQVRQGVRPRYVAPKRLSYGRDVRSCGTPDLRPSYSSGRYWVPGRYELREHRVWVPGSYDRVWVEPEFGIRIDDCGLEVRFQISAGYWRRIHRPGHYEVRTQKVWVPGYYAQRSIRASYRR